MVINYVTSYNNSWWQFDLLIGRHHVADKCVLAMKSAALKILAVGGVALAAYPVVTSLRPDKPTAPQLPEIIRPNTSIPAQSKKPETALSLSSSTASGNSLGVSVIIKPDPSGHFIAKAAINGATIPVLFDTGASIMALSFEDSVKLGFQLTTKDFRSQIQTANGIAPAAEILLKEVRIDAIAIQDVPALVLPPGRLETSLLGRSFWGRLKTGFAFTGGDLVLKN